MWEIGLIIFIQKKHKKFISNLDVIYFYKNVNYNGIILEIK